MIVSIDFEIFDNADYFDILDQLVFLFERRHQWDIGNDRKIKESKWLEAGQNIRVEQRVERAVVRGLYINKSIRRDRHLIRITSTPKKDNEFTPENALRYLNSALYIFVENFYSDRTFLQSLIRVSVDRKLSPEAIAGLPNPAGIRSDSSRRIQQPGDSRRFAADFSIYWV